MKQAAGNRAPEPLARKGAGGEPEGAARLDDAEILEDAEKMTGTQSSEFHKFLTKAIIRSMR